MSTSTCSDTNLNSLLTHVNSLIKEAARRPVTISKDGQSYRFNSLSDCANYFSKISSFSKEQIMKMIEGREQYICGFYITYEE